MPISYEEARSRIHAFRVLTTLEAEEFDLLLIPFEEAFEESEKYRSDAGRKPLLRTFADKLFFILYYITQYPRQEAMAFQFGMSLGQTNFWIQRLTAILKEALQSKEYLPTRKRDELLQRLEVDTNRDYAIDGTERRRRRPKDSDKQKKFYSGKSKAHTNKNDVIVGLDDQDVTHLTKTVEGKKSDKKLADEEDLKYPEGTNLFQDAGFQGYKPAGVNVFQPMKKPRGDELPPLEKEINSIMSKIRVTAEHVISGIKRIKILSDVFRNTKEGLEDTMMEIGCGLHNFRTAMRGSSA